MDTLSLGLITVAVASAAAFFIYMFSTMGQRSTFEDAIKEQKARAEELLGKRVPLPERKKSKDQQHHKKKKQKGEKSTEKGSSGNAAAVSTATNNAPAAPVPVPAPQKVAFVESATKPPAAEKHHVEIVEDPEVITPSAVRKPSLRRDSIKSILLNKDEPILAAKTVDTIQNHFEKIHPKDDLELKLSHVQHEVKAEVAPPVLEEAEVEQEEASTQQNAAPVTTSGPVVATKAAVSTQQTNNANKVVKSSAQKKVDLKKLIIGTSLSTEEVQGLIEALLNKGAGGEAHSPEWVQPRSDAMSTLKKQLTQLEDQLKSEQENSVLLQAKLRDLRAESSETKQRWSGSVRKLEMELGNKNAELNGVMGALNGLKRDVAQLNQVNQALREEKILVQKSLQAESSKRAEIESQLSASLQHSSHLESQLSHAFNSNQEINAQLHSLQLSYKAAVEKYSMDEANLRGQWEQERAGMGEREGMWGGRIKELEARVKELETSAEDSVSSLHNAKNTIQNLTVQLEEVNEGFKKERTEWEQKEAELGKQSSLASSDLESELAGLKSGLTDARKALTGAQTELSDMQTELDRVREANEELRGKNSKLSSHLSESENRLSALVRTQQSALEGTLSSLGSALSLQLNPDANWAGEIERKVKELQGSATAAADVDKLRDEVKHYQEVLAGTESLLSNLQRSLEAEEGNWKKSLLEKETRIRELETRLAEEKRSATAVVAPVEPVPTPVTPSPREKELESRVKELEAELALRAAEVGVPSTHGDERSSSPQSQNGSSPSTRNGSSPVTPQADSPSKHSPSPDKKKKKGLGGLFSSKSKTSS